MVFCTVQNGVVDDVHVTVKALQDSRFIKDMKQKIIRGQGGAVRAGGIAGPPPFGYKIVRTTEHPSCRREVDLLRSQIVVRIFAEYAAGVPPRLIVARLNADGVRTTRGGLWSANVLTGPRKYGGGILRNPIYAGRYRWRKTTRRAAPQGKVVIQPVAESEWTFVEHPELRIISDELFEAVQQRLDTSGGPTPLGKRRRPTYLLTGIVKCGECGEGYAIQSEKLGCTGHTLKSICANTRRVSRENLEEAVLKGLRKQLLHPALIGEFLVEFRAEAHRLEEERKARANLSAVTVVDLKKDISALMAQLKDRNTGPNASRMLTQELEELGAQLKLSERHAANKPRNAPSMMPAEEIVARLTETLDKLREELVGDSRDAAAAREIVRSIVEEVVVTPLPGASTDRRGCGPVRVEIKGSLSGLLCLADVRIDRGVLTDSCPRVWQDPTKLRFSFWVELRNSHRAVSERTGADTLVLIQVLSKANIPVRGKRLVETLHERLLQNGDGQADKSEIRVRTAMAKLERDGLARRVALGREVGWVLNHIPFTDDEWREREQASNPQAPLLPLVRIVPPDGHAIIVEEVGGRGGAIAIDII